MAWNYIRTSEEQVSKWMETATPAEMLEQLEQDAVWLRRLDPFGEDWEHCRKYSDRLRSHILSLLGA